MVPEEYWAQWESKGWRNFFENTAAVQFDHRALAVTTLAAVTGVWAKHRGNARLPPASRACLDAVMVAGEGEHASSLFTRHHSLFCLTILTCTTIHPRDR